MHFKFDNIQTTKMNNLKIILLVKNDQDFFLFKSLASLTSYIIQNNVLFIIKFDNAKFLVENI